MARSRGYFHCGGALSRIMTSRPVSPSRRVRGGRKDGRVIEHHGGTENDPDLRWSLEWDHVFGNTA